MKGTDEEVCKISVDDSYEGVGEEEGETLHSPPAEEFQPEEEETYIIPNPVLQGEEEEQGPCPSPPAPDPQTALASAIQSGRLQEVEQVLTDTKSTSLAFADISKEKLEGICNGSLDSSHSPGLISPLDLAAGCGRKEILELLVSRAAQDCPAGFKEYLCEARLSHPGSVLHCLLKEEPWLAEAVLQTGVQEEETEGRDPGILLSIGLLRARWGSTLETLLASGNTALLCHPVVEASVELQWHRLRGFILAELAIHVLFAVTFSLYLILGRALHPALQAALAAFPHAATLLLVLTLLLYLPLLLRHLLVPLHTHRHLLPRPRLALHLLLLLLLLLTVTTRSYPPSAAYPAQVQAVHHHLSAWALLLSWLLLFLRLGELPRLAAHLHTFRTVLRRSLAFLASVAALLVGFGLTFHLLLSANLRHGERFQSPINSLLKVVAMLDGELKFDQSFSESIITLEGSVQIIFLIFFCVSNIVVVNILIGIAVTGLREGVSLQAALVSVARALLVSEVEQGLAWLEARTDRLSLLPAARPPVDTLAVRLEAKQPQEAGLAAVARPRRPRYRAVARGAAGLGGLATGGFPLSGRVWSAALARLGDRREQLRREEEQRVEEAALLLKQQQAAGIAEGDYTSLYFKDAENQYEQIEGENKYGLRTMKDSLLKELKRDLMKLVRVDKAYSEMQRNKPGKPVNVRPGLALGVITLQAGAKGVPPALHLQDTD